MVWDFTCSDTVAPTHVEANSAIAGTAANMAEARKMAHYDALSNDYIIAPIAIETFGTYGLRTSQLIREISKRLIASTGDKKSGSYFRQRLGIVIQRGNSLSVMGTVGGIEGLVV